MSQFETRYPIARATGVCAETGRELPAGTLCVATLCETDEHDQAFIRRDFSIEAWESGARPEGLFSYWKTTVPDPKQDRKLLVDDEVLMDLFERLGDDDRPQRVAFRFVLALILMRKRLLRFVGRTGSGDNERWRFRQRGSDPDQPAIEVVNPHLRDEDVRELTDQLSEILQGDL